MSYRKNNQEKIANWKKNASEETKEKKRIHDMKMHNLKRFGGHKYACFERDGYKCTNCGSENMLIPHHIDESGQTDNPNNAMNNLITLCRSCHIKIHPPTGRWPEA